MKIINNQLLNDIPLEILQIIFDKLDFKSQIIFKQQCKYFYGQLRIYDLYNIDKKYKEKLNDNILKNFKYTKYLDASDGNNNNCITDEGIKNMNLIILNATYNNKITDKGIQQMNLKELNACNN